MEKENDSRRLGWLTPALVCLAFILPGLSAKSPPAGLASRLASGTAQSLSQALLLFAIIGLSAKYREYGLREPLRRPRLRDVPDAALSLAILLVIGKAVSLAVGMLAPAGEPVLVAQASVPGAAPVVWSLAFSIAVGYREELFYRAYVIETMLARKAGRPATVIISVALFAAGHAYQGIWGMVQASLLGLALSLLYLRGKGLHALAWSHAAFDFGILIWGGGLAR